MESRMEKYHDVDITEFQRSKKNADLYKEVYGNYGDFENLPIPENTNEIDIENLKSLVSSRNLKNKAQLKMVDVEDEVINISKEDKLYDINALLEKAKVENAKIKKEVPVNRNIPNYLANLESDKNTKEIIAKYDGDIDDDMPIVKEIKYSTSKNNIENTSSNTSNLSLDILSDLKPSGDTLVSEPITEKVEEEKEFFDDKVVFLKEDFDVEEFDEEDEFYEEKDHLFLKVLLIIIGLASILTAAFFIVREYTNLF